MAQQIIIPNTAVIRLQVLTVSTKLDIFFVSPSSNSSDTFLTALNDIPKFVELLRSLRTLLYIFIRAKPEGPSSVAVNLFLIMPTSMVNPCTPPNRPVYLIMWSYVASSCPSVFVGCSLIYWGFLKMILICMDRLSAKIAKVGCRGKRKLFFRSGNARMYPIGSMCVKIG